MLNIYTKVIYVNGFHRIIMNHFPNEIGFMGVMTHSSTLETLKKLENV